MKYFGESNILVCGNFSKVRVFLLWGHVLSHSVVLLWLVQMKFASTSFGESEQGFSFSFWGFVCICCTIGLL